ncbi:hypothetical protein MPTK1_1g00780 [Marchantia polymorpha subsp. ruderalis]|uniref:Uncharacterized protein n=2 Tax=Marchantia polymorpha TaxID=3197 RepID=A0AAF6AK23_MARPO|nr:hypothetical protein MARPO_0103s0011 [Marchantia polymorpha]BBM96793.1 hypothetical protein Mp_1g00780 [Marchantia polymorpha subsp. ruderalis]|eukprot:PTQ32035.1 hypothetical protein MARPO_0103s0011 [Marchantia polymorpha]
MVNLAGRHFFLEKAKGTTDSAGGIEGGRRGRTRRSRARVGRFQNFAFAALTPGDELSLGTRLSLCTSSTMVKNVIMP